jgi:hypothetical protein
MRAVARAALVLGLLAASPASCRQRSATPRDASVGPPRNVRETRKAGTWYDADPRRLGAELDGYLAGPSAGPPGGGPIVGLLSPHAGYRFSGPTAGPGFAALGRQRGLRRVIVIGISHHLAFRGVAVTTATHYDTPLGALAVDRVAADALARRLPFVVEELADADEHSVEMQMPFLRRVLPDLKVIPLLIGSLDLEGVNATARALAPLLDGATAIVASSDLTHRGAAFGYEVARQEAESLAAAVYRLDHGILPAVRALDAAALQAYHQETGITMCGRLPVMVMVATLRHAGLAVRVDELAYTTSGHVTQDWTSSVSYLSLALRRVTP